MTTREPASTPTEHVTLADLEDTPRAHVFEGEPQTIRLTLEEGEHIPPHQHPGRQIVFHVLEGRVAVTLGADEHDVTAGELLRFDGDQDVSPKALEDSSAVLVLAPRADD